MVIAGICSHWRMKGNMVNWGPNENWSSHLRMSLYPFILIWECSKDGGSRGGCEEMTLIFSECGACKHYVMQCSWYVSALQVSSSYSTIQCTFHLVIIQVILVLLPSWYSILFEYDWVSFRILQVHLVAFHIFTLHLYLISITFYYCATFPVYCVQIDRNLKRKL